MPINKDILLWFHLLMEYRLAVKKKKKGKESLHVPIWKEYQDKLLTQKS